MSLRYSADFRRSRVALFYVNGGASWMLCVCRMSKELEHLQCMWQMAEQVGEWQKHWLDTPWLNMHTQQVAASAADLESKLANYPDQCQAGMLNSTQLNLHCPVFHNHKFAKFVLNSYHYDYAFLTTILRVCKFRVELCKFCKSFVKIMHFLYHFQLKIANFARIL